MKSSKSKTKWLEAGYQLFGKMGTSSLNVERLSLIVGLNRSSFYHYFGEIEIFENHLFDMHIDRFKIVSDAIDACINFQPDLIKVMGTFKLELEFHRQLLINESVSRYRTCFDRAKALTEEKIFRLWTAQNQRHQESTKDYSLFQAIRDFYLLHYQQTDEKEINSVVGDIQLLLHGFNQV